MIFKPASRYPVDPRAIFVLGLTLFSGLGALIFEANPGSLAAFLPEWAIVVWGLTLVSGSGLTLLGMAFQTYNGIILEQIGSMMVGVTTVFYSALAFMYVGTDAAQPVGIILAWGLACFVRYIQLHMILHPAVKAVSV